MTQPPDQLDEDKERLAEAEPCPTCERDDGDGAHWAGCPEPEVDAAEPDYEQIIEDRARARGPDPEAIMWGGEDIPS
jgi:hypothetical protein